MNYQRDIILQVARGVPGDEVQWTRRNYAFLRQIVSIP
jgi:hypothetical protein